jgi:hypothetical protein
LAETDATKLINLKVANLVLGIDAQHTQLNLELPQVHRKFSLPQTTGGPSDPANFPTLILKVTNKPIPRPQDLQKKLCQVEAWELWRDGQGQFVFTQPHHIPLRWVVVDPAFSHGEIRGDFSSIQGNAFYPLFIIDIVIFANWLATYNDLILHAAGVAIDGKGYGFVGASGRGKSTLMRDLAGKPGITVLGEDQIILRQLDGRFWIFGTPWHLDPNRCSPVGVPLSKLFFLNREATETVTPVSQFEGIIQLMQTAFVPFYQPDKVSLIMERLAGLAEQVPFYTLSYRLGTDILPRILDA